ncbi:hypothetical protein K491DRAFT_622444 [Lophiostoma macrostomum CBS 122681]|uniref:MARVEL domain-containing protein n=1 Tax=Lophiostoma macrostomum CBS 122681 TaxID=1314788 RepID=A0A6A6TI18_9PLEO|nr:hypothetical protein K491DRAFT_622444 [Lophiostoma macrostomum CBS 122681]
MGSKSERTGSEASTPPPKYQLTPEAAYQQTQPPKSKFLTPKSFHSAIDRHLDNPAVSLFRLGSRILQFIFALAAGISYAVELSNRTVSGTSNSVFIYAQVLFGLTIITLVIDALTIRAYRFTWIVEWTLCILWFTLFAVFHVIYIPRSIDSKYARVNVSRMRSAVWLDLVSALLWFASAVFSTTMCCSGMKGGMRGKRERWHLRNNKNTKDEELGEMETGTI